MNDLGFKIGEDLPDEIKENLEGMLSNWKSVFSTGPPNHVCTSLIEHEIHLTNDTLFK